MGQVVWPQEVVLACIVRDGRPIAPSVDDTLEGRDELLFVTGRDADEVELERLLTTGVSSPPGATPDPVWSAPAPGDDVPS